MHKPSFSLGYTQQAYASDWRAQAGLLTSITRHDITRGVIVSTDPAILVLTSLSGSPKHGYAMMEDIQNFSGRRLGPGTLYGALTQLEERKWIAAIATDERRKPYKITPAGTAHLKSHCWVIDGLERRAWECHRGQAPVVVAEALSAGEIRLAVDAIFSRIDRPA